MVKNCNKRFNYVTVPNLQECTETADDNKRYYFVTEINESLEIDPDGQGSYHFIFGAKRSCY